MTDSRAPQKLTLLQQVRHGLRLKHHSIRTEEAYVQTIKRFILFHRKRHPAEMGVDEIRQYLSHLANHGQVSASTQNQALSALLSLYREVPGLELEYVDGIGRAKRPQRVPTVLTREEARRALSHLSGEHRLMASPLYGAGWRVMECVRLRVKDIDFGHQQINVRDGKGGKDCRSVLPEMLVDPLRAQLARVRLLHGEDLRRALGSVYLPYALEHQYPNASEEWGWQWVFPASGLSLDPRSGVTRRHHASEDGLRRAVKRAVHLAGITKEHLKNSSTTPDILYLSLLAFLGTLKCCGHICRSPPGICSRKGDSKMRRDRNQLRSLISQHVIVSKAGRKKRALKGRLFVLCSILAALSLTVVPIGFTAGTPDFGTYTLNQSVGTGISSTAPKRYIVQLADPPLASYRGGILGLAPTNPAARGEAKLNPTSPESRAYLDYLASKQASFLAAATQALGRAPAVAFRYRYAYNGVALTLAPSEVGRVAALPGVRKVRAESTRRLLTDAGPAWIGAPSIWSGSGTAATKGEGVVVGVIDTGVNTDHPSFADVGGDGYDHTNPRGTFYGLCDPVLGLPFCNDKLIGVYDFTGTTPEDDNQHGSHTASTAAGNVLQAAVRTPTITLTRNISGVAPHANLITYKACVAAGCVSASTTAAIDQATADVVDVINYSIGGGSTDPWDDTDSEAFLGARDAGVFASVSAGNDGPRAETIGSPANAPWVMSVGASTHNRAFVNSLTSLSGGSAPADITGRSFTGGYGPAKIVYAGDYGYPLCGDGPGEETTGKAAINPFLPGTFNGEIVVCDRGTYGRVEKAENVMEGGAGGFILANDEASGSSLVGDAYPLPGVHVTYADGARLKAWLATPGDHTGTIAGTTANTDAANGDVMASFSSRGPDKSVPNVLKPDVTAPGVDVLAAVNTLGNTTSPVGSPEFGMLSGTSMSSPHAAGAAALVRALHPTWTPAEVQSAIMTTALNTGIRDDDGVKPATPFAIGAGRVDLTKAGRAGLVLDETQSRYLAASPSAAGDPTTLNIASLANTDCRTKCSWTRVVKGALQSSATWTARTSAPAGMVVTVSPSKFTLAPGATQTLTITADVSKAPVGKWLSATATLSAKGAPDARLPITIQTATPTPVSIDATSTTGSYSTTVTSGVPIQKFSSAVAGLAKGKIENLRLEQDPASGGVPVVGGLVGILGPYDAVAGVHSTTIQVPAGARFLTADITRSTSPDVDLYVGLDQDGDGAPDAGEEICASASAIATESCKLQNPAGGTYWVLVRNWQASLAGVDDIQLAVSVIPGTDNRNLTVAGPSGSVAAGQPFAITLGWNEPALAAGDVWFALVEYGSDSRHPNNAGSLLVRLNRTP